LYIEKKTKRRIFTSMSMSLLTMLTLDLSVVVDVNNFHTKHEIVHWSLHMDDDDDDDSQSMTYRHCRPMDRMLTMDLLLIPRDDHRSMLLHKVTMMMLAMMMWPADHIEICHLERVEAQLHVERAVDWSIVKKVAENCSVRNIDQHRRKHFSMNFLV
jgi:hypothetical protein